MNFAFVVAELNRLAEGYLIGDLQRLRQELKGHRRVAGSKLFSGQTTFDEYAFHHGGRSELQFNVGIESFGGLQWFRHGVAFSLEPSQSLPTIEPLIPKIERFNQYIRLYGDDLADYRMWHFIGDDRSTDYSPSAIPSELVRNKVFIFLGKRQASSSLDLDGILEDLDRLLPLYRYVEGRVQEFPTQISDANGLKFEPGCTLKKTTTVAALSTQRLNVLLRHNEIQYGAYSALVAEYGSGSVGTENATGTGNRVDVVVKSEDALTYYEIKTDLSARACVRSAIAQLLEYSFWPSATRAKRLVVVGEPELDPETSEYLRTLREGLSLPLYYVRYDDQAKELLRYDAIQGDA